MTVPIFVGGLIDRIGLFDLGDIIVEVGGVPIETVDDLMYQVSVSGKKITFLIKKTPAEDLKKLAIAQTPSLRKQINKAGDAALFKIILLTNSALVYTSPNAGGWGGGGVAGSQLMSTAVCTSRDMGPK